MKKLSTELSSILEHYDMNDVSQLLKAKRQKDFKDLMNLLSFDTSINAKHRNKAIFILGEWGDPVATNAILRLLPSLDVSERITAISALGKLGSKNALEGILQYANDPSDNVRKFVTYALGKINTTKARTKLLDIAKKDPKEYIRKLAFKKLSITPPQGTT